MLSPYGGLSVGGLPQPSLMEIGSLTWDVPSWKLAQAIANRTPGGLRAGEFSPDHAYFVSRNDEDTFGVYETASGKLVGRFKLPKKDSGSQYDGSEPGVFSPSSKLYFVRRREKDMAIDRLFAIPSCKLVSEWHAVNDTYHLAGLNALASWQCLSFSGDESLVALADGDGLYYIVETATGAVRQRLGKKLEYDPMGEMFFGDPYRLALSPDAKRLAAWNCFSKTVVVWDLQTGKEWMRVQVEKQAGMVELRLDEREVGMAWSPDGRILAVSTIADRGRIQLWEMASRRVRREFTGHQGNVRVLAFSPDGCWLASGSADTTVLVWDVWGPLLRNKDG